ncbi:MAG: hypothetical protein A2Y17_11540 [Clostridiales bacterium GWF2_38_85]|nr:MAG: hypothetical protein A2Y17_11540 [Clostridiales bacterium GWF2_38_85]HBL85194.1 hypothetical protein [Clostridiales bacterium]
MTSFYYLQSRFYDPDTGRFINADSTIGANGDLLSGNLFAYCSNNPVNCADPNGHAVDTVLDIGFFIWGLIDFIKDPSWENAGWLAVDALFMVIPFATGGSRIFRAGAYMDNVSDICNAINKIDNIYDTTKIAVIGKNMTRVNGVANVYKGITYGGFSLYSKWGKMGFLGKITAEIVGKTQNAIWLINKLQKGYTIINIGVDARRAISSSYILEEAIITIWRYRNIIKSIQIFK